MADDDENKKIDKRTVHIYPLVKHSDMREEMRNEVVDLTVSACEKFSSNYETAARNIKDTMDKRFGIYWHVVVGEGFGFEVTYETENILYLYFGGNMAIVLWKCS